MFPLVACNRRRPTLPAVLLALLLAAEAPSSRAVILLGTGDPTANTTAPTGDLADSGWQFQGDFGGFLGTAIAANFFITARHVAGDGSVFRYRGVDYEVAERFDDPNGTDLTLWRVHGTLPDFAPLYPREDEAGQPLVVIGRGTERGPAVLKDGALRGWTWGSHTHVRRWGVNVVARTIYNGGDRYYLYATFDEDAGFNEAHLSVGDSGGAVFLKDGAIWKLAGINYAVDGPFYSEPRKETKVDGALFDCAGFYYSNDGGQSFRFIDDPNPLPSGFYASRISTRRRWIHSIIDPTGDRDRDGTVNLLEYAFNLDPERADVAGLPEFSVGNGVATLVYRQVTAARDLQYKVEKSSDLITWQPVGVEEEWVDADEYVETYKVTLPVSPGEQVFLRVAVTRP